MRVDACLNGYRFCSKLVNDSKFIPNWGMSDRNYSFIGMPQKGPIRRLLWGGMNALVR